MTEFLSTPETWTDYTSVELNSSSTSTYNVTNQTSPIETVLTPDIILWEMNEREFAINLPTFYCLGIAMMLGFMGSGSSAYIFGFRMRRNNTNIFTALMSTYELFISFLMMFECYDKRYPMYSGNLVVVCKAERYLMGVFVCGSGFMLLCITFDRYFKICYPLKRMSARRSKHAMIASFVVPVVAIWPNAIFRGPSPKYTAYEGVVGSDCTDEERYADFLPRKIYYFVFLFVIAVGISIIIIMHILIFIAIRKFKKFASTMNIGNMSLAKNDKSGNGNSATPDNSSEFPRFGERCNGASTKLQTFGPARKIRLSTTLMFFTISAFCFISFLPMAMIRVLNTFGMLNEANMSITKKQIVVASNVSHLFNGCLNPITYLIFNREFRREISKLLGLYRPPVRRFSNGSIATFTSES
ncbi:hypothetical protein FSP39_000597 [Pinctada imbricata]|uniref:G-protein coupled receptors family 1 profile domain-containing protein n=1 Tax=Pinctada imbricata TaxID=66713 RepID=A0AA88YB65_PINIB|nr:hypothetical protein FSP39_000597 [Pinctada imbricata]